MADRVQTTGLVVVRYNVLRHATDVLVKRVEILPDNTIKKHRGGSIPRGSTITTETKPLHDYAKAAFGGGVHQYIMPSNVILGDAIPISPKDLPIEGGVDRTAGTLKYVEGPAIVTFDHDPSDYAKVVVEGPQELVTILLEQFPRAFAGAAFGAYDSSGSFIYDLDGNQIRGRRGFHVVFACHDAREIPGFNKRLFKRLWLTNFGYIHISRDGKALPRTIYDTKVLESQQPLFAGGSDCINGKQCRPEPILAEGGYMNPVGVEELTEAEEREFQRLLAQARMAAQPECERKRREYMKTEAERLVIEHKIAPERAKRIVETRMAGNLIGAEILYFDEFGPVSVADVLANLDKYDEATLADPIDPDESNKAILYVNAYSGVTRIYSHKHGGTTYQLAYDLPSLQQRLQGLTDEQAREGWSNPLGNAELRDDELDLYLQAVKQRTGIGIGSLRKAVKQIKAAVASTANGKLGGDPGLYLAKKLLDEHYDTGRRLIRLESGQFWRYTGSHWERVAETILMSQLQTMAEEHWDHIKRMWDHLAKKPSALSSLVSSSLDNLGSLTVMHGDPLRLMGSRLPVINCRNGEVWLSDSGPELRKHSPDSYLTSCSPIEYDPTAEAPTFELAVHGMLSYPGGQPFEDQDEMLRHIEELLGYAIQPSRKIKVFILIYGPGDNGKSQLVKLVAIILGNDAIAFDRLSGVDGSNNRFATAKLVGKLVVADDDVDHEYLLPDGLLKKIAEEKPLTAEEKFKKPFQFIAQVVVMLLANSLPKSRDLTRGMQTRAKVINLPRSFLKPSECSPDHPDIQRPELWKTIYEQEMPGVLNRLIAGFYRVAARGDFLPPLSAVNAFNQWLMEANVVARFLEDGCEKIDSDVPGTTTSILYQAFIPWAEANGVQPKYRPQANKLRSALEDLGVKVEHSNKGSTVYGYRPKRDWHSGPYFPADMRDTVTTPKAKVVGLKKQKKDAA